MTETIKPVPIEQEKPVAKRPLLLSLLCLYSFVYFSLIGLLFLVSAFWSGTISYVVNTYVPDDIYTQTQLLLIFIAGFLLNALAFTGAVLIWRSRRSGYYLLALASLSLAIFQLLQPRAAISTTAVYIGLIILFGIFYRKLR